MGIPSLIEVLDVVVYELSLGTWLDCCRLHSCCAAAAT